MAEVAVNTPFESNEIKEIACQELMKRLNQLSPLMGAKEYSSFEIDFQIKIILRRAGESTNPSKTLAWGLCQQGKPAADDAVEMAVENSSFQSGDPNNERLARHMPLTVETSGKGGAVRRKVRIDQ